MADRTIKISFLPQGITQQQIREALSDEKISRIHLMKDSAFVEFQTTDDLETLEFTTADSRIEKLNNAQFNKVDPNFQWGTLSSDSSSIQELKHDNHQKAEQPFILSDPRNLITITNCDQNILNNLSQDEIKRTVFPGLHSVNRVLKSGNKLIIQIEDPAQTEKLDTIFPDLKITSLGNEAYIDLEAETPINFATEWMNQHQIKIEISNLEEKQQEEQSERSLHDQIIPKINKTTSMETNFLNQQSQKTSQHHNQNDIQEKSEEQIHTTYDFHDQEETQEFILNQPTQTGQNDHLLRKAYEEQLAHEKEQQEIRRKRQIEQELKRQREEEQERRIKEQKQRKQKEIRRMQQQEERKREQEERIRRQEEQKRQRIEQQARQMQLLEGERKRKLEQQETRRREEERRKREEMLRKQYEQKRKQQQERLKRELESRKFQQTNTQVAFSGEQLLQGALKAGQRTLQGLMGTKTASQIKNLLGHQTKNPTLFWGIIFAAVLFMLLM